MASMLARKTTAKSNDVSTVHERIQTMRTRNFIGGLVLLCVLSPAMAKTPAPINYPAEMQGSWCKTSPDGDDGFTEYERCHNAQKPTIQIEGAELREAADFGCHLTKPLVLKPTSRIARYGIASQVCDEVPGKEGYMYSRSGNGPYDEHLESHSLDRK